MGFVQLRQAVLGVPDVAASSTQAVKELGLAPGFADLLLADIGMHDESIVLGDGRSFLEFVAPVHPEASIARWLAKGGGPGGYALAIQVSDVAPFLARMSDLGLDPAADVEAYGYRIIQLRPKQLGLLVELDEVPDPDKWFWDEVEKQHPSDPQVDGFSSLELSGPDPAAQAALWGALFDVAVSDDPDGLAIRIGDLPVRFVAGERAMLSAIGLRLSADSRLARGSSLVLDGVRFDLT